MIPPQEPPRFEFRREEVRRLRELGWAPHVPEEEIRAAYDRLVERAKRGGEKPDSSFLLAFTRRACFVRKSSYREKLLTALGALQSSAAWSRNPHPAAHEDDAGVSSIEHRRVGGGSTIQPDESRPRWVSAVGRSRRLG